MIVVGGPAVQDFAGAAQLLDALPTQLSTTRTARGLTVKQAALAIGVSETTVTGLEAGSNCTRATATAVLRWLAT